MGLRMGEIRVRGVAPPSYSHSQGPSSSVPAWSLTSASSPASQPHMAPEGPSTFSADPALLDSPAPPGKSPSP